MSKDLYGEYRVILSVLSFIGAFCYVGMGQAALMSATRGFDGNFTPLIKTKLWANMLGAAAILLAAIYYATIRLEVGVAMGLLAAALLFPISNLVDGWTSWLNGKSSFRELSVGRVSLSFLSPISLLLVILAGARDLWIIVTITFFATGVLNLLMLRRAAKKRISAQSDQDTMSYARHATIALAFGSLLSLDVIILEHFHGAAEVATYAVALLLPDQLKVGFGLLNQAMAPKMYGTASFRKLLRELRPVFYKLVFVSLIIAAIGFFVFPYAIKTLFTEKYGLAGEIGKWLWVFTALTAPINTFLGAAIVSRQHAGRTYVGSVGYSAILLGFCFAFLPDGAAGFVHARVATYFVTVLFHLGTIWWLLRKEAAVSI